MLQGQFYQNVIFPMWEETKAVFVQNIESEGLNSDLPFQIVDEWECHFPEAQSASLTSEGI